MQTATHHSPEARVGATGPAFVPLHMETRVAVPTANAAHYLSRQPQTLRSWSSSQRGPLRPLRVHGRLAWKTEDIRRLLGVDGRAA
jgi:hypothetical protein